MIRETFALAPMRTLRKQVGHGCITPLRPDARLLAMMIAVTVATGAPADAMPLSLYRYEAQAEAHCPGAPVVWLDLRKGVYYLKRHKRYGQGVAGLFVCQKEASDNGYRRSLLGRR